MSRANPRITPLYCGDARWDSRCLPHFKNTRTSPPRRTGEHSITRSASAGRSGYDAPVTSLLFAGSVEGASNPTYGDFHGNPTYADFLPELPSVLDDQKPRSWQRRLQVTVLVQGKEALGDRIADIAANRFQDAALAGDDEIAMHGDRGR